MTTAPGRIVLDYPSGPNDRQAIAHVTEADELLYGGAAGGGKTDYLLAEMLALAFELPGLAVLVIRKQYKDLSLSDGILERLEDRLPPTGASYHAGDHVWTLPNGSTIELGHLQAGDASLAAYMGGAWQLLVVDQAEEITEYQYRRLRSRLRASRRMPIATMRAAGYRPKAILSANPIGVGMVWLRERFVKPANRPDVQPGDVWRPLPDDDDPDPGTRVFIPATVDDNIEHVGHEYVTELNRLPADDRAALRFGSWDVFTGQRFREFRPLHKWPVGHVLDPEDLPLPGARVPRAIGIDYGSDAPFAALWGVVLSTLPDSTPIEGGLLVVYRELYQPGLTPRQQARLILDSEPAGERIPGRPSTPALDPSCWAAPPDQPKPRQPRGNVAGQVDINLPPPGSIAASYRAEGLPVVRANNQRRAGCAAIDDLLRHREDGLPRMVILSTCPNLIRTLPQMVRGKPPKHDPEVYEGGEDHLPDALRYLVMQLHRQRAVTVSSPAERLRRAAGASHASTAARLRRAGF